MQGMLLLSQRVWRLVARGTAMDCFEAQELLTDYVCGGLTLTQRRAMAYHFCACERCRRDKEVARLLVNSMRGISEERPVLADEDIEESPIVALANRILFDAINRGASEVQVQPRKRDVRVLYRVNGWLREARTVPKSLQSPLLIRLKILASLDIASDVEDQRGEIAVVQQGTQFRLDVCVTGGKYGEEIVLRLRG